MATPKHIHFTDIPAKPETMFFQKDCGYERVEKILEWSWSYTFNRWGALVIFPDGKKLFTWPKL